MIDEDVEAMTTTFNEMCDIRRDLKNCRHATRVAEYHEINKKIRKSMKKAKEDWIGQQCTETE